MLHKCSVCGLFIPSSSFVIFPATLSRPPYTYISLCPSPCWPCLCIVCRVVCVACAVCTDVSEHVCVYVSLGPEETQSILQTHHSTLHCKHMHPCLPGRPVFSAVVRTGRTCACHLSCSWSALCASSVPLLCPSASSATGTRARVARVRAEYPGQLDYSGCWLTQSATRSQTNSSKIRS